MSLRTATIWLVGFALLLGSSVASAATVVLDTAGFWRFHHTMKGLEIVADGAIKPLEATGPGNQIAGWAKFVAAATPAPPAAWAQPEFDDSAWTRGPARLACRTPFLSRLCLRGGFLVTDPAKVPQDLALTLEYHGGAVVYLNGQELARQHLPAGAALAQPYPPEAFVDEAGKLITLRGDPALWPQPPSPEALQRIASRDRKLAVAIPQKLLRPGLNVLAIELVRAPYDHAVVAQMATSKNHGDHRVYELSWNTCEIRRVQLTAEAALGLVPAAVRPAGVQVWNSDPVATDFDLDFGNPAEPLRPIQLVGTPNGVFSGKVVVGSDQPLRALTASVGDLQGPAGSIPAAQVRVRYGMPWDSFALTTANNNEVLPFSAEPTPLLALFDKPIPEIPVYTKPQTLRCLKLPGQPPPVFGAVASVWARVAVPAEAKPGTYTGQVTLQAQGWPGVKVPVTLQVLGWKLPPIRERQAWIELIEAPDTLAVEYDLPLWSEKHWDLIGQSLAFCGEAGSKVLFVPLLAETNAGNAESMVRWVKKPDGTYAFDFAIMDRYLDLAEKNLGPPQVIVFNVWDRYLTLAGSGGRGFQIEGGLKVAKSGPLVTVVDPVTGKTQNVVLPAYTDPVAKAQWKPLFEQVHQRLRQRGLEKAMHLGMVTDVWAAKEHVEFLKEVSGDLPWANAGHYVRKNLYDGLAQFGYQSSYFGTQFGFAKSLHGWKNPLPQALFERVPLDNYPLSRWRTLQETCITGSVRGIGRLGADTWLAVKDRTGARRVRVWERFPAANWGYLNANCAVLAPSPDGPVATQRFIALTENSQECEAIIVLEKALDDKAAAAKLGADLAARCQQCLDERRAAMWRALCVWQQGANYSHELTSWRERASVPGYAWFLGSGWQERSAQLYALAAQVAAKLGEK